MTRLLRRLLGRDDPPTLVEQMKQLWGVSDDWTIPQSAQVVPNKKPRTFAEWTKQHGKKAG